eukprot:m.311714 g.311714  ORF g.311714 m.311714 type:complete len:115 (-) comp20229_c0_seq10:465-809(-)
MPDIHISSPFNHTTSYSHVIDLKNATLAGINAGANVDCLARSILSAIASWLFSRANTAAVWPFLFFASRKLDVQCFSNRTDLVACASDINAHQAAALRFVYVALHDKHYRVPSR